MGNSSLLDRHRFPAYFSEDVEINPFIGAGAAGQRVIDEFNSDHFDHSQVGFFGGSLIYTFDWHPNKYKMAAYSAAPILFN